MGHGHTQIGRVMFNEFNLRAPLPAITCFRLQVMIFIYAVALAEVCALRMVLFYRCAKKVSP